MHRACLSPTALLVSIGLGVLSLSAWWGWGNATSPKRPRPKAKAHSSAWSQLRQRLGHRQAAVRKQALQQLLRMGAAARPLWSSVHKALQDPSWELREAAAQCLAKIGLSWRKQSAVAGLVKNAKHKHWRVRAASLGALGFVEASAIKTAQKAAKAGLQDAVWEVREKALEVYGRLAIAPPKRRVLALLSDGQWQVRSAALWGLTQLPLKGAGWWLEKSALALQDPEPAVHLFAVQVVARTRGGLLALQKLYNQGSLRQKILAVRGFGQIALGSSSQAARATARLQSSLSASQARVREAATLALGRLGPKAKKRGLLARLQDKSDAVRVGAIWALHQVGASQVRALAQLLGQPHSRRKRAAARTLSALGAKAAPATPFLVDALLDADWRVRREVAWALLRIGPSVKKHLPSSMLPILINGLQDRLWKIRYCIAKTLGRLGPSARIVIGWFGPKAVSTLGALRKLKRDKDPRVRRAAIEAIKRITVKTH